MIEKVVVAGELLALILRAEYEEEGVNFLTPPDSSLQLGVLKHRSGTRIRPHLHKEFPRIVPALQEVLHVQYGRVGVEFYTPGGERVDSATLEKGDTILLVSGGHGFNVLEDCKLIEVKQGPYFGSEQDKEHLLTRRAGHDGLATR